MKFIERLLAALAWLQIFISPAIIGAVAGVIIWLALPELWGIVTGVSAAISGFVAGIVFAEKARHNKGTVEFMSRIIAHPELREKEITNDSRRTK